MKVIQSIEFEPITEDYIKELLRKDIEAQLPAGATIKKIEFVRKLNPTRIEAEVTAVFGDSAPVAKPEEAKAEAETKAETTPLEIASDEDDFDESECVMPKPAAPWDAEPEKVEEAESTELKPAPNTLAGLFAAHGA